MVIQNKHKDPENLIHLNQLLLRLSKMNDLAVALVQNLLRDSTNETLW